MATPRVVMAPAKAVLIAVPPTLAAELVRCARSRGVEAVTASGVDSLAALRGAAGLCIVGSHGDVETAQTVRSIGKLLPSVPVAILNQGLASSAIVGLARQGVVDVIDVDAPPEDLFAQAHAHFARSGSGGARFVLGDSASARELRAQIDSVAQTQSTVLLTGETGTGKGLAARELHRLSRCAKGPFVHADGSAFAPSVFESELFGHERGAFTSASARRHGRFELAEGGTIFLDEIGELDLALQVKLLRVLQDRVYERVGGERPLRMNARVIAATNSDLSRAVQEGRFRADLFYRLNVFRIHLPPLRERVEDVPMLVAAHLEELASRLSRPAPRVSASFLATLERHHWPGNIRELVNVLERCLIERSVGVLEAGDLDGILEVAPPLPPLVVADAAARSGDGLRGGSERVVGPSEAMALVRRRIDQIAPSPSNVLVTGETGTGKELVARAIHEASGRHPLIVVGVPELSEELLELELFGQETGALGPGSSARAGLFESAHGGTVFLDEIGEAPLGLQAKILRVLETGEVRRLGAQRSRRVDTRVMAATHRDLEQAVRVGSFREDLYYRLCEAVIDLPPLRERSEDVEAIARILIAELAEEAQRPVPGISDELFGMLRSQAYPGNVRELRTQLRNLLIAWDGVSPLRPSDLVEYLAALNPGLGAGDLAERQRMVEAYRDCRGNQEAARRRLGFSRGEWRHRWSRFGLDLFRKRP